MIFVDTNYTFIHAPHQLLVLDCHSVSPVPRIRSFLVHQEKVLHPQDKQNPVLGHEV